MKDITLEVDKPGHVNGAWLQTGDGGDVHVIVGESGKTVVIGRNTPELISGKMNPAFTNPALIIDEDGCALQYADDKGEVVTEKVDTKVITTALLKLLTELKGLTFRFKPGDKVFVQDFKQLEYIPVIVISQLTDHSFNDTQLNYRLVDQDGRRAILLEDEVFSKEEIESFQKGLFF